MMKNLFLNCNKLEDILGLSDLDTSNCTDLSGMFAGCEIIPKLDVKNFNTENVKNMAGLFYYGCRMVK